MRIDRRSEARSLPLTIERALTALIQGRNSIEKARRQVADALEIFSFLEGTTLTGSEVPSTERLRRLRHALDQLEASGRQLQIAEAPSLAPTSTSELG
jgi:hypothetical protein